MAEPMLPSETSGTPERGPLDPFPMQDGPPIPWFLAGVIHEHLYRHSQPLEMVARRGGFGWAEVAYMWSQRHQTTKEQRRLARDVTSTSLEKLGARLREIADA